MTKSIDAKLAERGGGRTPPRTIFGDIADFLNAWLGTLGEWPKLEYQKDPVGFARDVLGYTPCRTIAEVEAAVALAKSEGRKPKVLWKKQIDILEAIIPENASVAVRSGQKTGKSKIAAILALWYYGCFPESRVMMTATSAGQINRVLWREVLRELRGAVIPLDGEPGERAETGLKGFGLREIRGATAKTAEGVAGFSDPNMLYICDEASGIPDNIFDVIQGNRAGGARLVMFSQPTKTAGTFFEAFHKRKAIYTQIDISSLETPNAETGRYLIPGLAGAEWIETMKRGWGESHPIYQIRVLGKFVMHDEARIVSAHMIAQALEQWKDLEENKVPEDGRLYIGFDPAGPGAGGDESAFVPRRGRKVLRIYRFTGQNEDALLVQLLGIIATHKKPRETEIPVVVVDRSGPIGIKVSRLLQAYAESHAHSFELVSVVSSDKSWNRVVRCDRVRDELWFRLAEWFQAGGAIPEDSQLEKELHAPKWYTPPGRDEIKATPKDELRKILEGRSPDSADALCLSVWESTLIRDEVRAPPTATQRGEEELRPVLDPYAGQIDPYG